ncbi:MAG: sulfite exporter TauE/SafE family protein, partial [Myxococcota bacterium]
EGGGAVAFPVMTLLLHVAPPIARNFSLACQSFGMTSASLWIVDRKIPFERQVVAPVSLGGVIGLVASTHTAAVWLPPPHTKLFFVSTWLAFGAALFAVNRRAGRAVIDALPPLEVTDRAKLFGCGLVGGAITAVLGNGIDIFTFTVLTLHFRLSEKVATPTSVLLMTANTLVGFGYHAAILRDVQPEAWWSLLAVIPVVTVMAPLGAWTIDKLPRLGVVWILLVIIVVQFVGALGVIRPSGPLLAYTAAVFVVTALGFRAITRSSFVDPVRDR